MWLDPFFTSDWLQDLLATILTFAVALGWLRLMDALAHRGWIEQRLSRKIIHIGTGPLFVLCWNLFSAAPAARWLAALVPFAITAQFFAVGMGWMKDPAAVQAMTRHGDPREILRGPLYYGIVFVLCTILFWRHSPVGIGSPTSSGGAGERPGCPSTRGRAGPARRQCSWAASPSPSVSWRCSTPSATLSPLWTSGGPRSRWASFPWRQRWLRRCPSQTLTTSP